HDWREGERHDPRACADAVGARSREGLDARRSDLGGVAMRAVRCHAFGPVGHLALEEIASPTPGPHQAVVTIKAAAVNFPDTLIVQGKYQIKPELPFTPGAEFAGIVKAVGEGGTRVKPGDAVLGVGVTGGFAEEALIDAANLVPLPQGTDFAV